MTMQTDGQLTGRTIMTVFAHPDDEAFGCAGTLAKYAAVGADVIVVCATRGEVGEISDLSDATPETLGQAREQELRNAAAAFGAKEVVFLDYIDGQVINADFNELTGRIVRCYRQYRPDVVLTFGKEGIYGHPDHVTTGAAAVAALQAAADAMQFGDDLEPFQPKKLYFSALSISKMMEMMKVGLTMGMPLVGWAKDIAEGRTPGEGDARPGGDAAPPGATFGTPDEDITAEIDISGYTDQKVAAMQAHKSQMAKEFPFRYVTPEMARVVMTTEVFSHADAQGNIIHPTLGQRESDLFAGL